MPEVTAAAAGRRFRLLIVDDDAIDRRVYARLLAAAAPCSFEIIEATTGAAGLAALRAECPDCLLLDFRLPDMDGLTFLAEATTTGELPCATVLVTGQGNEAVAVESMKRGVQDYLVKDRVSEASLLRAITNAISQAELRRDLARSLAELQEANATLAEEIAIRKATGLALRAAKEAAEQASAAKTRFVAMVTHELRTPLNGILGYAELLRLEGGLAPLQAERVKAMLGAGRHLSGMIEQVLDFAAIEAGHLTLRPELLRTRPFGTACLALVALSARERGLALRLKLAPGTPPRFAADAARLRQVVLNLLANAVKYTPQGSVELRLAPAAAGGLRIEVADTGPGIPPEHRDQLFQDFERLAAPHAVEGAGLGLAIAARIMERMGGRIGHAENPGGGSIFWLEVPRLAAQAAPGHSREPAPRHGLTLLLVDDNAMNRDVIQAFLAADKHEVLVAASGEDAVALAAEERLDLILMDVRMPGIGGLEATRRIRALQAPFGQVPILALTASAFPEQVAECRAAGMDGHVAKPVDRRGLARAIACALRRPGPRAAAPPPQEPAAPRLDRNMLQETLRYIPRTELHASLAALRARQAAMQHLLEQAAAPEVVAEAAHQLGALAGMFGFTALSRLSCTYEREVSCGGPARAGAVARLGRALQVETGAALALLDAVAAEAAAP